MILLFIQDLKINFIIRTYETNKKHRAETIKIKESHTTPPAGPLRIARLPINLKEVDYFRKYTI